MKLLESTSEEKNDVRCGLMRALCLVGLRWEDGERMNGRGDEGVVESELGRKKVKVRESDGRILRSTVWEAADQEGSLLIRI